MKNPPCRWQNCYFSPSKSGFKDQHLAGWDGVRCGLHVYQVTHFKDTLPYTASDESKGAKDRAALSLSLLPGDGRLIFSIIIGLFFLHQQWFWRIWSLPLSPLKGSKHSAREQSVECLRFVSAWEWSIDGTVGSCYGSVASTAKEEEGRIST